MKLKHWKSLLATLVLILFVCWAIPTCIRGPVEMGKSSIQHYQEKLEDDGYQVNRVVRPGGTGVGVTITSPDGNSHWGIGIGVSSYELKE